MAEANVYGEHIRQQIKDYLADFDNKQLVTKLMAGIRVKDLTKYEPCGLAELVYEHYPFILDPLPNLYFTRDPFATIGNGVTHKLYAHRHQTQGNPFC